MLSETEFADWLENPATHEVLSALKQRAIVLRQMWAERVWSNVNPTMEAQISSATGKGEIMAYEELAGLTFDDYENFASVKPERDATGW